jgi:hypothetical protein
MLWHVSLTLTEQPVDTINRPVSSAEMGGKTKTKEAEVGKTEDEARPSTRTLHPPCR